jgi:uncharacterized membrane protein
MRAVMADELSGIVRKNIESLTAFRRDRERQKTRQENVADAITKFAGSMPFVYLHVALFGGWLIVNSGLVPGIKPFDPFPFVMLAMWASVEAIFLSTFVLISQNRMNEMADRRADLDLQINLLAEHELTQLINLVEGIALKLNVDSRVIRDLEEIKKDVEPAHVLETLEKAETMAKESA